MYTFMSLYVLWKHYGAVHIQSQFYFNFIYYFKPCTVSNHTGLPYLFCQVEIRTCLPCLLNTMSVFQG